VVDNSRDVQGVRARRQGEIEVSFTVDAGINLINLERRAAEEAVASGRDLHGH